MCLENFVPNFARVSASLNKKQRNDKTKPFGHLKEEEEIKMVHALQETLMSSPVTPLPILSCKEAIDIDASSVQLGCVLFQYLVDESTKPIRWW